MNKPIIPDILKPPSHLSSLLPFHISMAVNLGKLSLLLDVASPRGVVLDRKGRTVSVDVVLSLPKRDFNGHCGSVIISKGFECDGEVRNRVVARGKSNSEVNGVDFDAESSDEENGESGVDDENYDCGLLGMV